MFSNLPFPSNTSRRQSIDSNNSNAQFGHTYRRNELKTSSLASSILSLSTTSSSSQDNTVRRRRQLASSAVKSVASDSPNPLRAPPLSLLGPAQDNAALAKVTKSISSTTESSVESFDIPTVAFGELHYLTFAGSDESKNCNPCNVWIIVEILCSLNQGADKEPFAQKRSTNKSFNNPGFLKSVALTLSPLQDCQIAAVLGQLTAATLSPDQTITAIVLVTLEKSLLPSTRPTPQKENGKPEASSSRRRPTSDLLNEELLNQLLGKFKRTSQGKEEKMEEQILRVKVAYDHSLFPAWHQISHEVTPAVTRATIYNTQHGFSRKHKQKQDRGSPKRSVGKKLDTAETENAAERIIRVLREGLRFEGNNVDAASNHTTNAGQAVKLLNDFLAAATNLPPDTNRTLEMLKFRYSMLVNSDDQPESAQPPRSPKRCHPFQQQKAEGCKSFESESLRRTPRNAEVESDRRNAFEIDREEMNFEQALTDVTNKIRCRGHDLLSGGTYLLGYDGTVDLGKDNAIPPPLFSPKRGRDPGEKAYHGDRRHLQTNIGSASFYAAEVEAMARQAFGGATTTCHHRSEFLEHGMNEEEGNDKARKIWERMRISSHGSGTSAKSTEVRYSDESADEAERVRECKVVGAPWLA
jgi:hypothetical protein